MIYNVEYIKDCAHYNKIISELGISYYYFDEAIDVIISKINTAINEGKNSAKYGFGYENNDKNKKLVEDATSILQVIFEGFGYDTDTEQSDIPNGSNMIRYFLIIKW